MTRGLVLVALLAACGGDNGTDADAGIETDGSNPSADAAAQDPQDPVEEVPAWTGAYAFGKLTTEDSIYGDMGTFYVDDTGSHKVMGTRVTYARYRDAMVLQSKTAQQIYIYDQATTMASEAITLPSDSVGNAIIRGGLVYIGGGSKIYSYEIATKMWRYRMLPETGACHHLAAGATRLFAICANLAKPSDDDLVSTWANKTMSDEVMIGTLAPGNSTYGWIAVAPGEDTAYFGGSRMQGKSCIARMTRDGFDPCVFAVNALANVGDPIVLDAAISEDGRMLFVNLYGTNSPFDEGDHNLWEVDLTGPTARSIRTVDSYATCPDNSVTFQDGTLSQRRVGGVNTDVRLGYGGKTDIGCPLKKL